MDRHHQELYEKICGFDIDGGPSAISFAVRLAKEQNWSRPFTARVIAEYRKFLLLAMVAGHPVSPPQAVDEAWHLHLLYTHSYWERLCRQVLPRPLPHEPTRGGAGEEAKFEEWYGRTCASYERIFGAAPPRDIWPPARTRPQAPAQRGTSGEDLTASRPHRRSALRALGGVVAFVLVAMLAAAVVSRSSGIRSADVGLMAMATGIVAAVIGVGVVAYRNRGGDGGRCGGWFGGGCGFPGARGGGGCDGTSCGSGCGGGGCGGGGCGGS